MFVMLDDLRKHMKPDAFAASTMSNIHVIYNSNYAVSIFPE